MNKKGISELNILKYLKILTICVLVYIIIKALMSGNVETVRGVCNGVIYLN